MSQVVTFGEIMVRLAPDGYKKLCQADSFTVNYTGAEANVCVSLANFGLETEYVTKLPDNEITDITLRKMRQYSVGVKHIVRGGDRMGLYYLERGASQRPSKVIYDRKYSSLSMAAREDFQWDEILKAASWFHFTGITAAIGDAMPDICEDACKAAKARGIPISCDLNYRKNLWTPQQAQAVMRRLIPYVDVIIGNEEDAEKTLGIQPDASEVTSGALNYEEYDTLARKICAIYGEKTISFTLRGSISASDNSWAAMLYRDGKSYFSKEYMIRLVDRVGGGDSFAAGLIYALHKQYDMQKAIEFAVAASCLKQTIEFDFNLSSLSDVFALVQGDGSGRVQR